MDQYLWKIENPILEIQVQECFSEFEAWNHFYHSAIFAYKICPTQFFCKWNY